MIFLISFVSGIDWCGLSEQHTMCLYKGVNTGKCEKVVSRGISPDEIVAVVDAHNELRQYVADGHQNGLPPAQNMKIIVSTAKGLNTSLKTF